MGSDRKISSASNYALAMAERVDHANSERNSVREIKMKED
jgi:hypothetical protein